jgi:hypothetical protein
MRSNIPEVFDSSKYDSMAEIKESAADMKKEEGGKEHLKEEREEVLSNTQREEEPIKSESVDTGKPSDIDSNSSAQPQQQLPPSPSTITAKADDMNSPSLEERVVPADISRYAKEEITSADQNLEVEDTNYVVVGKEKEDEEAQKKKKDNKEQQQHYSPSISASYMTSWHDYINAAFNVYSESIRAAAKIAEYSLGMFWEPWLGRHNKKIE